MKLELDGTFSEGEEENAENFFFFFPHRHYDSSEPVPSMALSQLTISRR